MNATRMPSRGRRRILGIAWSLASSSFTSDTSLPHVGFTPHVAVQTENGEWLDVTPHNPVDDYPFLQHAGTEQ